MNKSKENIKNYDEKLNYSLIDRAVPTAYRARVYSRYAKKQYVQGEKFDVQAANRWGQAVSRLIHAYLPQKKNSKILDIGCGGGYLLYTLQNLGYTNVIGIDASRDQVSLARQICENVRRGDALSFLRKTKNFFDVIFAFDIVEHLTKNEILDFFEGCYKKLTDKGLILVSTPNAESPWCTNIRYGDFTHETCFDPEALKNLMDLYGFKTIAVLERGPVIRGFKSLLRWGLWKIIRFLLFAWNLAETGSAGSKIYTRVFLAVAQKKSDFDQNQS